MFSTSTMTKTCPYCAEEIQPEAIKCKHCLSWLGDASTRMPYSGPKGRPVRLLRSTTDRKVWGLCGGLARLLNVDATILRAAYAVATVFTGVIPGVMIYLILGFVVPNDDDPRAMA